MDNISNLPIDYLELPARSHRPLTRCCKTVGDLLEYTLFDLFEIKGFGVARVKEVQECLKSKGLRLKE